MRKNYRLKSRKEISYLPVICITAGLLFSLLLKAQPDPEKGLPFITNYTPKTFKALPQAWCAIEDTQGIMYFGVQATILEYDGVKWRKVIFKGIPPTVVRSLARDKNGLVYYGAAGDFGYLSRDSLGQTHAVSLLQYVPESYRNFFDVWTIYVDGGEIYFQSREYIFRINEKRQVKTWIPKTKFMYAFFYDDNYFVHQQGVGFLKLVKDSLQLIPGSEFLGQERMQVMLPYTPPSSQPGKVSGKQYLVGLFYGGLFLFDGTSFSRFKTEADELIKAATLYKGAKLPNGNFALSTTGKGLAILDPAGKILQLINRDVGLQDESVYSVYSDSKGTLWLALDNGISRVETNSPLTQFTNQSGINTATLSIKRFEGKLYIGTTNGLLKFNNQAGRFEEVAGVPPNQTFKLVPDGNTLLVPNDGLFSIRNNKTILIRSSIGGDLQLSGLYISKAHPDMLLGGATFGVVVFYRDKATQTWRFKGHIPNLDDQFWTFSENNDGTIWAGTQSAAVYRLTPAFNENGEPDINRFTYERFDEAHGLKNASGGVYKIKGESWFIGDSSLFKFDETKKRFYPDTTFGRFPGGGGVSEFDIVEDHAGRVWLRFGKETILATPQPNGKYRIDKTPFLPLADRSFSGIYPEANGIVWICTTDGLIRYDESLEKNYALPFKTLLRHVTAGKDILNPDPVSADKNKVTVSFKNNTLRFEYAAPFFEQEDKTVYQTWLEGFEETWSGYDNNYYKEYTNLPAGKYHFHVRAKNVYQKVSEESVYPFTIRPAWYASWWAYLLYAIAALAIVYTVVRNRTKHLKKQHRELEKIVSERTVQLRQRVEELAVINGVQDALVREMDMQAIYELVGNRIRDVFNSQVVIIATFDHEAGTEHFQYLIEKGERSYPSPRPLDKLRQHLIKTKQKIVINQDTANAMKEFGLEVLPGTAMPKSSVFVPLTIGDKINSYISLQNIDKEHAFTEPDVRLLETLANSMSVALENARLFDETNRLLKETEQRTAELAVINSVQDGLVREMNIQAIYDLVGNRICELFDTQTVLIRTFDQRAELEHWQYVIEKGQRLYSNPRPVMWANKILLQTRQSLLINENYVETAQKHGGSGVSKGLPPKSALFVPMLVGDVVRGSVSLQNVEKENAFNESDLRLLTTLTNSMSVALENARLFDETNRLLGEAKQRANELTTVNNVSQALASQLNPDELIKLVGDQMRDLFKANIVYLALLDPKSKMIHFVYQYGDNMESISLGDGLTSKIILSGEPLLINKDLQELRVQIGVRQVGLPAASYLGVPIPVGDEVIGVLSVQSTEEESRFNQNDLRLLSTIAASVGVALRKAKLFEEVQLAKMDAEAARKAAEKANEAKSAFLSTVSHELRTPLTSVLGFTKIIKKRLEEKIFPAIDTTDSKTGKTVHQISDNLNVVISEGERLTNLINEVLDLAKIEAGKMEWNMESVSMQEVAERAISATTSLFDQKNLALKINFQENLPLVSGDRDKLIQVMVNLISNAVKFTPAGTITCRISQGKNEIITGITDTGIGIAPADHDAVFEQFKQVVGDTLTDKPKGTGLGLPICKEIVEHHGGRIWLESEAGKGSTFFFAIPVQKTGTGVTKPIHLDDLVKQLKEQMAQSSLNMKGRNATILVVDDDDSIRSLLMQELGDAGYIIEEATNGKEALASIRNHRPDLIILDVMMPEMNGFDVAAILKNDPQTMDIPIIVLSIIQDKARGFRIGVDRYLTKPIDTAQLFTEVGSLLEQGKSKKKVMVVDEDSTAVRTLTDVLQAKGYQVVESDGKELVEKAIRTQPDIIILNSVLSDKHEIVQSLRFEKGLENVLFLIYQ